MRLRLRSLPAVAAAVVLGAGLVGTAAQATAATTSNTPISAPKVFFWPRTGAPAAAQGAQTGEAATPSPTQYNDLLFHGGVVEHHPRVYITYWGTQWQHGFRTGPNNMYTANTAMNYENKFFANIGGTAWNGIQTQYCDNVAPGSTSCKGQPLAQYIANSPHVLGGVWVDPSPVPSTIVTNGLAENLTDDPIAAEAVRAEQHFGYNPDATYFVFTPPGITATAYGSVYCAYHSEVTNVGGHGIRYAFMPFTPEQGAGCGGNSVNAHNDAFGHGYFDSYSMAGGHEYAEAVTDPDAWPTQDGWNDYQTSENGDKCAYFDTTNLHAGTYYFAVQPMWSNEANSGDGGCAMKRGTGPAPVPSPIP